MRLNRTLSGLVCIAIVGCAPLRHAGSDTCPVQKNNSLVAVDVYDGPFSDMAILMPDEAAEVTGLWKLAYVYEAGRTVNIRCKYADKTAIDIHLPKKINHCRYSINSKSDLTLQCE